MTDWAPPDGKYRPRPQGRKPSRKAREGTSRSRIVFLLSLLVLVAACAFIWYRWIGPDRQAAVRDRLRPPGKISIKPAE